jgi:hypothetical protein
MKFTTKAYENVREKMKKVRNATHDRVIRAGVNEASTLVLNTMKAKLSPGHGVETGMYRRALGKKRPKRTKAGFSVLVGARHGYRIPIRVSRSGSVVYHDPIRIGTFLEKGAIRPKTGTMKPIPHIANTARALKATVEQIIANKLKGVVLD